MIYYYVLGVNKYRLEKESDIDVLVIDNEAVKKQQIERLSKVKEGRDSVKAQQSLENLSQAASNAWNNSENGNNCLAAAVECARARCTVGEITDTMAKVKFIYTEKATKFAEISILVLTLLSCFIHPIFHFWFLVTFGDKVTKILYNLCLHFFTR